MRISALCLIPLTLMTISCSSGSKKAADAGKNPAAAFAPQTTSKHKYAKLIELAGFRITEKAPGTLQIKFGVVNHSLADLGDVGLNVTLRARAAGEDEPPIASFPCKVSLGPYEWSDVTASVPTKLRVYELPDWQFLRATFDITAPEL